MATDDEVRAFNTVRDKLAETQTDLRAWIARAERAVAAEADLRAQLERVTAQRDEKSRQFDAVAGTRSARIEELEATVERVRHEANCWSFLDDESATVDELRDRIFAALDSTTPPPSPEGEGAA